MADSQNLLEIVTGNHFPRGFATPIRCNAFNEYYIPNSIEELQGFIKQFDEEHCFLTVYSFEQYDQTTRDKSTAIIDVIPFDFDDQENPNNALTDVNKLLGWAKRHGIKPRLHYSANKGFHVFIDLDPIKLKHAQSTLKRFVLDMAEAAGFTTLDIVVIGDFDRVIRIPNTIHEKTGRYCITIDIAQLPFLSMEDIQYMARKKSNYVPERIPANFELEEALHNYDLAIDEEIQKREAEELKIALSNRRTLFPGLHVKTKCAAYITLMANGVSTGSRDHALIGIIHKSKKDGFTYTKTLQTLDEFNSKCDPPLSRNIVETRLKYHWKKDYSICTFFSKICNECMTCPHNKAVN